MSEWIVNGEDAGKKLVAFLVERLGGRYSARLLKRALESNCCQVNCATQRFASFVLAKGDRISLNMPDKPTESPSQPRSIEHSRLLYEDDSILIYDKPAKVNCDQDGILNDFESLRPGLQLIHRLDRDTTGVLLFAKNQHVFAAMVEQFRQLKVKKSYLAIVDGVMERKKGSINNHLGKKHVYAGQTIWGAVGEEKGLPARTDWVLLDQGAEAALLHCFPLTGRTHQIRVHLSGMGHAILGDFQYCKKFGCGLQPGRHLLHAYGISFGHPVTGQIISINAPIPSDFMSARKMLLTGKSLPRMIHASPNH
jgi:RluA family pseudouridine synthase